MRSLVQCVCICSNLEGPSSVILTRRNSSSLLSVEVVRDILLKCFLRYQELNGLMMDVFSIRLISTNGLPMAEAWLPKDINISISRGILKYLI